MNYTKRTLSMLMGSIILFGCGFFLNQNVLAENKNYFDYLHERQVADKDSKELIIRGFCSGITTGAFNPLGIEQNKAKQSLFLLLLCTSNGLTDEGNFFAPAIEYEKETFSFKKAKYSSSCREEYKEKCNVAELTDNILTQVLSEYFTIKEADIFGVGGLNFANQTELTDWKNAYAEFYFKKKDFCGGNTIYKKTCKLLDSQMKQFQKTLKNLELVDVSNVYTKSQSDTKKEFCGSDIWKDIIYCGLVGEKNSGLDTFVELIYNELTYYTIFSVYYSDTLAQQKETKEIKSEYEESINGPDKFENLIFQTLSDLTNIQITYPVHVLLVAYQENLLDLRDNYLSKVVTPFYCLYHKFRNVQRKQ